MATTDFLAEFYGVKNIGIKFSGSKGFHLIIPWKAFPQEIYNQKTKDMFPEFPRIICEYLSNTLQPKIEEKILKDSNLKELTKKIGRQEEELIIKECKSCGRASQKKDLITWICPYCKHKLKHKPHKAEKDW